MYVYIYIDIYCVYLLYIMQYNICAPWSTTRGRQSSINDNNNNNSNNKTNVYTSRFVRVTLAQGP